MGILFYLNYIKYFIDPKFHEGLKIVPIILTAYLFYGIFFNLSIWYKLKKKTIYGAVLTISGALITIAINVIFVGKYSYVASSVGHIVAYFTMMVLSYFIGRKYFPIDYKLGRIAEYVILALIIFTFAFYILNGLRIFEYLAKTFLLLFYILYVLKREQLITLKSLLKWKLKS